MEGPPAAAGGTAGGAAGASGPPAGGGGPHRRAQVCRVCAREYAKYTCPKCAAPYCSLGCYQRHGAGCTERFYEAEVRDELAGRRATPEEVRRAEAILRRVHRAGEAEAEGPPGGEEEAPDEGRAPRLAAALVDRLGALGVGGLDDLELDAAAALTPEGRRDFQDQVRSGRLGALLGAWEPWWRDDEGAGPGLAADGTPLVQEVAPPGPSPAAEPLPPLAALFPGAPSPLLRWHLLDVLYAYVYAKIVFNGDWAVAAEARALVGGLSAVLRPEPPAPGAAAGPASGREAFAGCLEAAGRPALAPAGGAAFARSMVGEVRRILGHGRPAALRALRDLAALHAPAAAAADGKRAHARARKAAEKKLRFFLSWANEAPAGLFAELEAVAAAVHGELEAAAEPPPAGGVRVPDR